MVSIYLKIANGKEREANSYAALVLGKVLDEYDFDEYDSGDEIVINKQDFAEIANKLEIDLKHWLKGYFKKGGGAEDWEWDYKPTGDEWRNVTKYVNDYIFDDTYYSYNSGVHMENFGYKEGPDGKWDDDPSLGRLLIDFANDEVLPKIIEHRTAKEYYEV